MIRTHDSTAAPVTQTGSWRGYDGDAMVLVRLYSDGTMTAERKVGGAYQGEVALTPERGL